MSGCRVFNCYKNQNHDTRYCHSAIKDDMLGVVSTSGDCEVFKLTQNDIITKLDDEFKSVKKRRTDMNPIKEKVLTFSNPGKFEESGYCGIEFSETSSQFGVCRHYGREARIYDYGLGKVLNVFNFSTNPRSIKFFLTGNSNAELIATVEEKMVLIHDIRKKQTLVTALQPKLTNLYDFSEVDDKSCSVVGDRCAVQFDFRNWKVSKKLQNLLKYDVYRLFDSDYNDGKRNVIYVMGNNEMNIVDVGKKSHSNIVYFDSPLVGWEKIRGDHNDNFCAISRDGTFYHISDPRSVVGM